MQKFSNIFIIVFVISITLCPNSSAADQKNFSFTQQLRYINKSDAKNGSGEFSSNRTSLTLSNNYKFYDKIPVELGFRLRHFNLNDDSSVDLPDTLQVRVVNLGMRFPAPFVEGDHVFMGIDLMPQWNSAGDHNFASEAFRFNFVPSLIYKESDNLIFACGLWVRPQYDNILVPFFGIRYKPNERLSFNFLTAEPNISYEVTKRTKISLEFDFLSHEFEVTEGSKKGEIVRIRDWEAGLGIEHDFNKALKGTINIGWAFNQKYEYLSGSAAVSPDNSLYVGYKLTAVF